MSESIFRQMGSVISTALDTKVTSTVIKNIVKITRTEYDALSVKDPATLYVIVG